MSALSKHFIELRKQMTCSDIVHPNETCTQHFIALVWLNFFTFGQYYLPTLVLPLAVNIKSLNREMFKNALIDYGKCILIGNYLSTVSIGGICWFHKIFGQFYFPWFLRVPNILGTLMFNFFPKRIQQWQSIGILNMYIEAMIKKLDYRIIERLRKSRIFGTLMFMSLSALVMAGFKINGMSRIWFTSMPKPTNNNSQPCVHGGTCSSYVKQEFFKSCKLGLILVLLKFIISNYKRIKLTQPATAFKLFSQKLDYGMIAFTVSYNAVFKLLYCWFNNKTGENSVKNVMAAGFLSGVTYAFYPIYMIFTHGITAALQMSWLTYSKYIASRPSNDNDFIKISSQIINFINKLPIATIVTAVCSIQLVNYYILYPNITPIYIHKLIALVSNERFPKIIERIVNLLGLTGT